MKKFIEGVAEFVVGFVLAVVIFVCFFTGCATTGNPTNNGITEAKVVDIDAAFPNAANFPETKYLFRRNPTQLALLVQSICAGKSKEVMMEGKNISTFPSLDNKGVGWIMGWEGTFAAMKADVCR